MEIGSRRLLKVAQQCSTFSSRLAYNGKNCIMGDGQRQLGKDYIFEEKIDKN